MQEIGVTAREPYADEEAWHERLDHYHGLVDQTESEQYMDINEIKEQLNNLADAKYQEFVSRLIPGQDNILGVRSPEMRKIAKQIAKDDWSSFITADDKSSHEIVLLQGMVIGYAKMEANERIKYIEGFLPKITNWAICDSFVTTLKFTKQNPKLVWDFVIKCCKSNQTYTIRFSAVMLLCYYVDEEHIKEALTLLGNIAHQDYYVKMAVAWAISAYYVKLPELTTPFLLDNDLDDWTHNKALQKIRESNHPSKQTKEYIKTLKR